MSHLFRYGTEFKAIIRSFGWPTKRSLITPEQSLNKLIIYNWYAFPPLKVKLKVLSLRVPTQHPRDSALKKGEDRWLQRFCWWIPI
jgi:hypothetical protein